ncbi:MAG: ribonuclease P protein component [Hyphomicrobiaceae bacterium]|nr:ribonuclease P protein component [Hyphomicrobiaceae bacterium]
MSFKLHTLKKRADFLRARNGRYYATSGLVLQASKAFAPNSVMRGKRALAPSTTDLRDDEEMRVAKGAARFGFTATKKLGNAVMRNRIKRRLRAAVRQIAPQKAHTGYEYVLIGRASTLKRPFSCLLRDLTIAFAKVHAKRNHVVSNRGKRNSGKKVHKRRQNP